MNRDMDQERLRRLERKVDNLAWMMRLQTALLALIAVVYLLQISRFLFMILLIVIPLLIIFRRTLPYWGRKLGSLWVYGQRQGTKVSEPRQHSAREFD
jgi:hypothetical protein